jgi:upstream activation factor subunit UAF30
MPRQSKSKTSDVVENTTTATATATNVATKAPSLNLPVNEDNTVNVAGVTNSVPKTKKVVSKVNKGEVNAVIDTAPVLDTNNVEAGDSDVTDLTAQSTEFLAKLNQLGSLIASLKTEYRVLEKKWTRELKTAQKSQAKRKRKSGNRQPSGFVKPTKISDELAKFLDKPVGSEMARTDVTREINKYIRSHNLQDKENGRKINPDSKLQTLLKLKKTDELTYFNLQRYMSPHFSKAEKAVVV